MLEKVMIVDDDEKLRNLVKEYLEGYGFTVVALSDGLSLMESIRSEAPRVVILDIMLPEKNGLDLLREIRTEFSVPVIMLTAKGDDEDRIVGLELGADDYIPKPFNPRELVARTKAVIRRRPPRREGGWTPPTEVDGMHRRLSAIVSADVKGYSRLMAQDEMLTIQTLNSYRDIISSHVVSHYGRVVDSPGDNILAEFGSVVHAVECSIKIQRTLRKRNDSLPSPRKMEFRIGVNLGDVVMERGKIYGDGVNIAARVEKLAEPGGIAVSGTVHDEVENKLPVHYEYLGEQTFKNITRPVRIYQVRLDFPETKRYPAEEDPSC